MQKSRVDWLHLGDRNTKIFHMLTLVRRRRNIISMLKDDEGNWVEDAKSLKDLAVSYYDALFKSAEGSGRREFISGAFLVIGEDMRVALKGELSEEEMKKDLKGMGSYKAPGSDGYQVVFFKDTWDITAKAIRSFVKDILGGGDLPEDAAEALLVLIPNGLHPASMREFRLISLCNTAYKLVSKVVVGRLKEAWWVLIFLYQASFVPGRQSSDNVIVCQEFVQTMRYTKAWKGMVVLKLDLEKAYDMLECGFIDETLKDTGIPEPLVGVIMKMVSLGSCCLLWNGEVTDVIRPSRGLRKGCPLSPYFFVLCLDKLGQ